MNEYHNDGNFGFVIEPYKMIKGEQTFLIYNRDGNRHAKSYVHIDHDGYFYPYGSMDEYKHNGNFHFVIREYGVDNMSGEMMYLIYNNDGDRHPNKYLHIRDDGMLQMWGAMGQYHNDKNFHFVIKRYVKNS
jgi:hypothetical protein